MRAPGALRGESHEGLPLWLGGNVLSGTGWISWDVHGSYCDLVGFTGDLVGFYGTLVGFNGDLVGFRGGLVGFHRDLW
jgi:hypothetical protein